MAGEAVAEHVRMQAVVAGRPHGDLLQPQLHVARRDPSAAARREQRLVAARIGPRPQPIADGVAARAAEGDDARLAALAGDGDESGREIQIPEVDGDQLGKAQAAAVEQLQHGAVAGVDVRLQGAGEQLRRLVRIERLGQALADLRRSHARRRIRAEFAALDEKREETADARQVARDGARRQAAGVEPSSECAHLLGTHMRRARVVAEGRDEAAQVARVGGDGVRRRPLLYGKMPQIAADVSGQRTWGAAVVGHRHGASALKSPRISRIRVLPQPRQRSRQGVAGEGQEHDAHVRREAIGILGADGENAAQGVRARRPHRHDCDGARA